MERENAFNAILEKKKKEAEEQREKYRMEQEERDRQWELGRPARERQQRIENCAWVLLYTGWVFLFIVCLPILIPCCPCLCVFWYVKKKKGKKEVYPA